jgi:hypothetical protein
MLAILNLIFAREIGIADGFAWQAIRKMVDNFWGRFR